MALKINKRLPTQTDTVHSEPQDISSQHQDEIASLSSLPSQHSVEAISGVEVESTFEVMTDVQTLGKVVVFQSEDKLVPQEELLQPLRLQISQQTEE